MKNKILLVVSVLFGLMFLNSGLNKFFNYMDMPELNEMAGATIGAFVESGWLMPLVGIVEIIGGILVMLPKYRAVGAIMMLPITLGIMLFHLAQEPNGLIMSIILFVVNAWLIFENRDKYVSMIE